MEAAYLKAEPLLTVQGAGLRQNAQEAEIEILRSNMAKMQEQLQSLLKMQTVVESFPEGINEIQIENHVIRRRTAAEKASTEPAKK